MFYPEISAIVRNLAQELKGKKVAILGHMRPDGDCIGSQVGLCRVLQAEGVDAVCVNADLVPRRLSFLVGDTPFFHAETFCPAGHLAITVDCADRERIGPTLGKLFPEIWANLDHHISNTGYALHNIVESRSAATAEILAGVALSNGWKIDPTTAQAFYVGIATDTGQFRFPSTTRRVFSISGRLLDRGANPSVASHELYERESIGKMHLLEKFLTSLTMECHGRVCIGVLSNAFFTETGTTSEDTEGLVDYARSIDGVDVAGVLEERPNGIKGSLRCKNHIFRVDQVARTFGGGGHTCAAGFTSDLSFDQLYPKLLEAIQYQFAHANSTDS
jgi:bifunctional oligoribonuclease and PAP phosphatase NrnA